MSTTITLILMLATPVFIASMPGIRGDTVFPTYAFLAISPNPVGINQSTQVTFWLDIPSPTQAGLTGTRWQGYTVSVAKPDGTKETLGPFTADATGGTYTRYTPTQLGNYTFEMNFPGQTIEGYDLYGGPVNATYEASTSPKVTLTVQQEPISAMPQTPLPTSYWQRPIEGYNYYWSSISGNWLSVGSTSPYGLTYNQLGTFAPYTTAPNTAHIVWTKSTQFGGIVGGEFNSTSYYTGEGYERKFSPPIIINGVLYYNTPSIPFYGFTAVDLRTGKTLWYQNQTGQQSTIVGYPGTHGVPGLSMGQLYNYQSPNQEGVLPYLWRKQVHHTG